MRRTRAPGGYLKWIFLALVVAGPMATYFMGATRRSVELSLVSLAAAALVGWVWFLVAWATIPREDRHATQLGRYSLFWVAMRFFFPLYGIHWAFASLGLLTRAINESLAKRQMSMRASAAPAYVALVAWPLAGGAIATMFAGFVSARDLSGWLLADSAVALLWFLFMVTTDHARRFMILACFAEREKNEATRAEMRAHARG